MKPKKTIVITFRVDEQIKKHIDEMASEKEWSVSQVVEKICKEYFNEKLKAVSSGIGTIVEWTWKTYKEFCNIFGISEWTIILDAITLLIVIIGINIYKANSGGQ